ncbi:MAG: ABC transporter permease [Microbacterium sp.]
MIEVQELAAGSEPAVQAGPETAGPTVRRKRRPWVVWVCLGWLVLIVLAAVFADLLPLKDPNVDAGYGARLGPFTNWAEPLGTDRFARSELSRLVFGARISLMAASFATLIALTMGLIFGVSAGYFRGKVDGVVGIVVDSILAFPGLVLLMALAAVLGPSLSTVIVGLSVLGSVTFARVARANTLRIGTSEYVAVARGLGAKNGRLLFREILPNVGASMAALSGVVVAGLIIAEASLSFLGLGISAPDPSWGNMIAEARPDLRDHTYLVIVPAVALFFTIFSVNYIGDYARSRSDASAKL